MEVRKLQHIVKTPIKKTRKKLYIITGIHGNEAYLFEHLKRYLEELQLNEVEVNLILANELAAKRNVRFIDQDLNRSFNFENDSHECKLALELINIIEGDLILDLHTHTNKEHFCLVSESNVHNLTSLINKIAIKYCIIIPPELTNKTSLIENFNHAISIEVGEHNSIEGISFAKNIVKRSISFLEKSILIPEIVMPRTKFLLGKDFLLNNSKAKMVVNKNIINFSKVIKDQEISQDLIASDDFIAVLVSKEINPGKKILLKCKEIKI